MAIRENRIKNVAMRIIIDIRERKRKPKLKDFIQIYRNKLSAIDNLDERSEVKKDFQNKFKTLYGGHVDENQEDVKFNRVMSNFDRI
jgi:hypothetical protein